VIFVAFLYGVGIPMLFPIAALNLVVIYLMETYHMAYTYQKPPVLDDKLTKNAVSILRMGPLLFLCNGYWMLNNQQIFKEAVIQMKKSTTSLMLSGHNWSTFGEVN